MPKSAEATRLRILEAAYELFYREGYGRVGVDAIAARAGVTKRTLYYHFASKDALFAAVLERQHDLSLARIRRWAAPTTAGPEAVVEALFRELGSWASRPRWHGSGFTRMTMELAGQPGHPARAVARRHKAAIEAWLAQAFAHHAVSGPEVLARQVMLLLEGCLSLILIHADLGYAAAAGSAARRLVESSPESGARPPARGAE